MGLLVYPWRKGAQQPGVLLADGFTIDHVVITGTLTGPTSTTSQLMATVYDDAGVVLTGVPVSWRSMASLKVSVSSTGLLTFNAVGSASIIATVDGREYSVTATATAPAGNQDFWGDRYFGRKYFGDRYFG